MKSSKLGLVVRPLLGYYGCYFFKSSNQILPEYARIKESWTDYCLTHQHTRLTFYTLKQQKNLLSHFWLTFGNYYTERMALCKAFSFRFFFLFLSRTRRVASANNSMSSFSFCLKKNICDFLV